MPNTPAGPTPPRVPTRTHLAVDPSGRVTLRAYTEHRGLSEETIAFDCTIVLDGKKVGTAMNSGTGGANLYHFGSREAEESVTRLAVKWALRAGEPPAGSLDAFVRHLALGFADLKTARALFRRAVKTHPNLAGVVVVEREPLVASDRRIIGFEVREFIPVSSLDDVTVAVVAERAGGWRFHVIAADALR